MVGKRDLDWSSAAAVGRPRTRDACSVSERKRNFAGPALDERLAMQDHGR
jgi:hypothetical protein